MLSTSCRPASSCQLVRCPEEPDAADVFVAQSRAVGGARLAASGPGRRTSCVAWASHEVVVSRDDGFYDHGRGRHLTSMLFRTLVSAVVVACAPGCSDGGKAQVADATSHDDAVVDASDGAGGDTHIGDYSVPCDASPPGNPGPGMFWATCEHHTDCGSGWCVEVAADGVRRCHQVCVDCCPAGFVCRSAPGELDDQFLCFPDSES